MAALPPLPCRRPASGLLWVVGGLPTAPGTLAHWRVEAFLSEPGPAPVQPVEFAEVREVTVLPTAGTGAPAVQDSLPTLRHLAPQALLRLQVWLEDPDAAEVSSALLVALAAAQPLFVDAVLTMAGGLPAGAEALFQRLAGAGVPIAAELVLQHGGLDSPEAVRRLCLDLLRAGVRPYVLLDGAWLPPERRVPRSRALEIVRALRGWTSGLAVPQLVEEQGDGRRVPVIPSYVERLDENGVEVVNYEGRRLRYANPPDERG